ncbi:hypothetical protein WICPIJ_009258 [Wickerhamomyces pijperi]|uniref:HPP transmembrane region domain-containing protein n=1 Tax=Wickerhamomyces pijperi TaxID=599730 RepID=A0A9P8PQG0_WICPI|nr:hypothetical protein WICPIJ_009258 [Wickerhamomyces pijperi]
MSNSHHFTLDKLIDPYIPPSQLYRLPNWISRWLGGPRKPIFDKLPDTILWLDIFIGSFISILTIEGVSKSSSLFQSHHVPYIIASYGASAILAFNAINAPLAQPRNIFFGHFMASIIGVCICKLFTLSGTGQDHYYIGGALAVALVSVVMFLTNTIHPPAGATALIAVVDSEVREIGWWYIVVHIVSSLLMIGVALITNNVFRSYPAYWWTPYQHPVIRDEENIIEQKKTSPVIKITHRFIDIPETIQLNSFELEALESIKSKLEVL